MEKLYIEEVIGGDDEGWHLSYDGPAFQGFPSLKIDKETANAVLTAKEQALTPLPIKE